MTIVDQVADRYDERELMRDLIDLFDELANLLTQSARQGEFGRHLAFCTQADSLLLKLTRITSPEVLQLYESEAATVLAKLRGQFQLIDVVGRA